MGQQNRAPGAANWGHWADIPQAEVWEAVALSLGFEPKQLPGIDWRPIRGDIFDDCPEEFRLRLDKAERCVEAGTLKIAVAGYALRTFKVRLADLRTWAESLRTAWSMPNEFPSHAPVELKPSLAVAGALLADDGKSLSLTANAAAVPAIQATAIKGSWTPERRKELLKEFRLLGGTRPDECGKKGKRGALAELGRNAGVDKDTLADQLDKALEEKHKAEIWAQLHTAE